MLLYDVNIQQRLTTPTERDMTAQPPADFHCPWCNAAYHDCAETDDRGNCVARPLCIVEGDWSYMRVKGRWVAEHMPTATTTISYETETDVRNAVIAGKALRIITGSPARLDRAA